MVLRLRKIGFLQFVFTGNESFVTIFTRCEGHCLIFSSTYIHLLKGFIRCILG